MNKKKKISFQGMGLWIAFVVLCVILAFANPYFLTWDNMMTVLRQAAYVAVVACGMTFVIAMGGIDLSVGAVMAIAGVIVGTLMVNGVNIYLAILIAMLAGALIGSCSGVFVAHLGIPDFIVTMAMMSIIRGAVQVITKGIPTYGLVYPEFAFIAQGMILGIPFPIILTIIVFAIFYYVLYHTRFGRYVISTGSNMESARLVGIPIKKIKISVYALCGFLAAFAGVIMTSRLTAAMPDAGQNYEMDAIAATVIGGTSMSGGKAKLLGTVLGAVMMAVVRNGLNLLAVNTYWHQVVIGAIVLLAVGTDIFSNRANKAK